MLKWISGRLVAFYCIPQIFAFKVYFYIDWLLDNVIFKSAFLTKTYLDAAYLAYC